MHVLPVLRVGHRAEMRNTARSSELLRYIGEMQHYHGAMQPHPWGAAPFPTPSLVGVITPPLVGVPPRPIWRYHPAPGSGDPMLLLAGNSGKVKGTSKSAAHNYEKPCLVYKCTTFGSGLAPMSTQGSGIRAVASGQWHQGSGIRAEWHQGSNAKYACTV